MMGNDELAAEHKRTMADVERARRMIGGWGQSAEAMFDVAMGANARAPSLPTGRNPRATGDARYAGMSAKAEAKTIECSTLSDPGSWAIAATSGAFSLEDADALFVGGVKFCLESTAAAAERARILALLHDLRPCDEPYTRREWAIEQKGAKAMYEKIIAAISQPAKAEGE